jgi:hypothetical protein
MNLVRSVNPLADHSVATSAGATSSWDPAAKTVTLQISREFLSQPAVRIDAPYNVSGQASVTTSVGDFRFVDDRAPDAGELVRVAGPEATTAATEHERVHVYVDGVLAAGQDVDTSRGLDSFAVPVVVPDGTHELRVEWEVEGEILATDVVTVTHGPDVDDDGVGDNADNCVDRPNEDQANMDGDAKGDVCDPDMDGDGHSNTKETVFGTDPADPASYPPHAGLSLG